MNTFFLSLTHGYIFADEIQTPAGIETPDPLVAMFTYIAEDLSVFIVLHNH